MEEGKYRPLKEWEEAFKDFDQVKKIIPNQSAETLLLTLFVPDESTPSKQIELEKLITQDELEDTLYKFNDNPIEVVKYFLREWGILVYIKETLVAFFDIYAYSAFIEKNPMDKCILEVGGLFKKIKKDAYSFHQDIKLKHWILSDSIIVTPDISSYPLKRESIDLFLMISSALMYRGMRNGFPLRGAIGGGGFYKDGEIIVSSALVDACKYEKKQNWFGTVITPNAMNIINKYDPGFTSEFDKVDNLRKYVRKGVIPWKEKTLELPKELFYIISHKLFTKDWTEYLPDYLRSKKKLEIIENSHCIYKCD